LEILSASFTDSELKFLCDSLSEPQPHRG